MTENRISSEAAAAAIFALLVGVLFLPAWLRGLTYYWGDLTYIHHPWRALPAQLIQAGRPPLWNPYAYFGMPMSAAMQGSLFYPLTVPFFIFGFPTATAVFQALHYWLACWLMFLWLKRHAGFSGRAALGGASVFGLCGFMAGRLPFLNHLAVLSLVPALLIFFRSPALLGTTLALAFLCGYPPFLAGGAVAAWALLAAAGHRDFDSRSALRDAVGRWAAAAALAMALSACVLIPAAELAALCRRSSGIALEEVLEFGYRPADLAQWFVPWLIRGFNPAVEWWKAAYLGLFAWGAIAAGFLSLPRRRAAALGAIGAVTVILILGGSNSVSRALWENLPGLRMVRYPGNLAYLALPALALLTACGIRKAGWKPLGFLVALELTLYGVNSPTAPRDIFTSAGPLVRLLQGELEGVRYLLSPLALEAHKGLGIEDWKHRLYGLTGVPFRLSAGGNFGEPLVPRSNYDVMDFLYRQPGAAAVARHLSWAGVRLLLTPRPVADPGTLRHEGAMLWQLYRVHGKVSIAYLLDPEAGESLPAGFPETSPALGTPLAFQRERPDRLTVSAGPGNPAGWAYIAEPLYPGWRVDLETADGMREVRPLPALGAFQRVRVPSGPWRLHFRYEPWTFSWGAALSAAALLGLALYWYNRLRVL